MPKFFVANNKRVSREEIFWIFVERFQNHSEDLVTEKYSKISLETLNASGIFNMHSILEERALYLLAAAALLPRAPNYTARVHPSPQASSLVRQDQQSTARQGARQFLHQSP
jgi:hypothetical protein